MKIEHRDAEYLRYIGRYSYFRTKLFLSVAVGFGAAAVGALLRGSPATAGSAGAAIAGGAALLAYRYERKRAAPAPPPSEGDGAGKRRGMSDWQP